MIHVIASSFDPAAKLSHFASGNHAVGGIGVFIGRVRQNANGPLLIAMTLEHYPGMTERQLREIEDEAVRRWTLLDTLIIHRVGRMLPGEPIVFVATAASHRREALESCEFLIDWLKTKAPFWKLEETEAGEQWVEARESDDFAAMRWELSPVPHPTLSPKGRGL